MIAMLMSPPATGQISTGVRDAGAMGHRGFNPVRGKPSLPLFGGKGSAAVSSSFHLRANAGETGFRNCADGAAVV
jgi:hypothetical protein